MIDIGLILTDTISAILIEWLKRKIFPPSDINERILHMLARHRLDNTTRVQLAGMVREYLDRLGSSTSPLHLAVRSPKNTTGQVQRFTGGREDPVGASVYMSEHGAFPVWGEIARCYEGLGGTSSRLGFPISPELPAKPSQRGTTGQVQRFEGINDAADRWDDTHKTRIAVSIYSSRHGAYPVWGAIGQCYEHLFGTTSRLGFPTSPELQATRSPQGTTGQVQRFEGGPADTCQVSIYASKHGTYAVWGEMACRYESRGGTSSHLGFPTSAEIEVRQSTGEGSRWVQYLEGGDLWV